jgi:hypothetical protein
LADIDFRIFEGERVVVHFGGTFAAIDATTFGNSLVAFVDAVVAINNVINPGQQIEILLEAQGTGSFRAVVRRVTKEVGGFFSVRVKEVFWAIVATAIWEQAIKPALEKPAQVVINTDEVIIQHGHDRIIVPRKAYDAMPNVRKDPEVKRKVARTFKVLETDASVQDFGLTGSIGDSKPLLDIPRPRFAIAADAAVVVDETTKTRIKEETARLVILKAWLNHAARKWSFEWNGVPISAPIKDEDFLQKIDDHEVLLGAGDAIDAIVEVTQVWDEAIGTYRNESYVVTKVLKPVPRKVQPKLPDGKK